MNGKVVSLEQYKQLMNLWMGLDEFFSWIKILFILRMATLMDCRNVFI